MKECGFCRALKPAERFAVRDASRGSRQPWCRECMALNDAARYRALTEQEREERRERERSRHASSQRRADEIAVASGCVDCGERDPVVLDFDHVGVKTANVSDLIRTGASWARIEREIAQCEVRCANDHKRVTAKRLAARMT